MFFNMMLWFRNGTPQISVPTKMLQTTRCLLTPSCPYLLPHGQENWEAQKIKIMSCNKNNLLETAMEQENEQ